MTESVLVRPDFYTGVGYSETLGPEVGELCTLAGYEPYPEQQMLLDDIFAIDPVDSAKSAAFEVAVVAARQQLKTGVEKQAALGWLFISEVPLIIWSAHEFGTAIEAQQDMVGIIEGCPDLAREVRQVITAAGKNAIILNSGARIIFKARTTGGGRGLTGDKIILDEAFALQPMHLGALLPTLTQVPDPQILYGSSAGLVRSDVLRGLRDRGRVGSRRLVYAEWMSDRLECESPVCDHRVGTEGCALDNRDLWRQSCFVSFRKDPEMETVAALRRSLPPAEFAREMLGWWDDPDGEGAFSLIAWNDLEADGDEPVPPSEPFFAVDVSPDHSWAAIVSAGTVGDRVQVEVTSRGGVVDHRPGVDWLPKRILELRKTFGDVPFAFAGGGGFEALVPELEREGVILSRIPHASLPAACGYFFDLVTSKRLSHLSQDALSEAVMAARQKKIGDSAFVWIRSGIADLAPLYAACVAAWQASATQDPALNVW